MIQLDHVPERFSPAGGATAESLTRAFGPASLREWDPVLRETLQNSWDARLQPQGPISFSMHFRTLTDAQSLLVRETVFAGGARDHDELSKLLGSSTTIDVLEIADAETHGLDGPTRSDIAVDDGVPTRFRSLVRNFGRPTEDEGTSGGAYGIGKAVLFEASRVRTVIVYSQARVGGRVEPRLIVVARGPSFPREGVQYTGRHFWGRRDDIAGVGIHVEPLTGDEAVSIADGLGIRRPPLDQTGTTLVVLAPSHQARDNRLLATEVRDAALRWAWPHLVRTTKTGNVRRSIDFEFSADGSPLELPDPRTHPDLGAYAESFMALERRALGLEQGDQATKIVEIPSSRVGEPAAGALAYRSHFNRGAAGAEVDTEGLQQLSPTPYLGDRVALIRPTPLFVVKYLDVVGGDDSHVSVHGAFLAAGSHEREFRESEPVAHDDWVPRPGSRLISKTLRAIREAPRPVQFQSDSAKRGGSAHGLSRLSRLLGAQLTGWRGDAADGADSDERTEERSERKARRAGSGRSGVQIEMHSGEEFSRAIDGFVDIEFAFRLLGEPTDDAWRLTAVAQTIVGAGEVERESPMGSVPPQIVGWRFADGKRSPEPPSLREAVGKVVCVTVRAEDTTAIAIDVEVERAPTAGGDDQ